MLGFNPHPARRPGATLPAPVPDWSSTFQSSPSPEAGCYVLIATVTPIPLGFNPHPARRPGATFRLNLLGSFQCVFQSSPSPEAGCYPIFVVYVKLRGGFNPHPARRPGATSLNSPSKLSNAWFQSSPSPEAGCYQDRLNLTKDIIRFQSSPSPEAGCYTPPNPFPDSRLLSFNPHPARRPGATIV